MKSLLMAVLLIVAGGCTTTPTGTYVVANREISPQAVRNDLRIVAHYGAREALRSDPHARAYLEAATVVLGVALLNGEYNPNVLEASLSNISVHELQSPQVKDAITAALGLYRGHVADALTKKLDASVYVRPLLEGIREGIEGALAQ